MRYSFIALITILLVISGIKGFELFQTYREITAVKYDYGEINEVKYGLFNLDLWKEKLFTVIESEIGEFDFSEKDYASLKKQIEAFLYDAYSRYFESGEIVDMLMESNDDGKVSLNKMFMALFRENIENAIVQMDFKSKIPLLSEQLMSELKKKTPEIKKQLSARVSDMLFADQYKQMTDRRSVIYEKYGMDSLEESNTAIAARLEVLEKESRDLIYLILGCLFAGLITLLLARHYLSFNLTMSLLTAISTVFLILGVLLPMIDLDARLTEVNFRIMDQDIAFGEQVVYFQSKSIVEVTQTLLEGRTFDLKVVGVLILLFSIILPFSKMLLSTVYLYIKKARRHKWIEVIIFYMGKWSMADVFTVAIFMAYIGFYGLISAQLSDISTRGTDSVIETINYSKLSPGIIFFVVYCLLSVIISSIIHRHFKKDNL